MKRKSHATGPTLTRTPSWRVLMMVVEPHLPLAQPGQRKARQTRKAHDDFGDALLGTKNGPAPALLAGLPPPPVPPTVGHPPGQPASSSGSAPPPTAQEERQGEAAPPPGIHPRPRKQQGRAGVGRPRNVVAVVQDIPIVEEEHGVPGMAGYYHRMKVECPLHSAGKFRCIKSRNCGPGQTAAFGHMEPAAFLAAWVQKRPQFATRHGTHAPGCQPGQLGS